MSGVQEIIKGEKNRERKWEEWVPDKLSGLLMNMKQIFVGAQMMLFININTNQRYKITHAFVIYYMILKILITERMDHLLIRDRFSSITMFRPAIFNELKSFITRQKRWKEELQAYCNYKYRNRCLYQIN